MANHASDSRAPGSRAPRSRASTGAAANGADAARRIGESGNWETQMRKGVLELLVLATIAREPAHGYRIASAIRALGLFEIGEGTLYPLLARLLKRGAVKAEWRTDGPGAARKVYRITPGGEADLAAMRAFWRALDAAARELEESP